MTWRRCESARRRVVALAVIVGGLLLFWAGSASASTTIGQLFVPTDVCASSTTYLQAALSYTVPASGVITSWGWQPGSSTNPGLKLKVAQPMGDTKFKVVAEALAGAQTADKATTYPAHIPVQAGEVIGIFFGGASAEPCETTAGGTNVFVNDDEKPGSTSVYTTETGTLPVEATIVESPASAVSVPSCPAGGPVTGTVTADSGTTPKALHYMVDGGPEQVVATSGSPGNASIALPAGVHSLEFWGEDQLGQQEPTHHTVTAGCPIAGLSPLLVTAAQISNPSESNSVFAASSKPTLVTSARKHRTVGTTFKYTLDKPASVRFDFTQPGQGRKLKGRCVARTSHNKRKPKCAIVRGSLTFTGHAGRNTVKFYGWLSKHKKLKRGNYTLVITATTPGVGSTSQKLTFTIVK